MKNRCLISVVVLFVFLSVDSHLQVAGQAVDRYGVSQQTAGFRSVNEAEESDENRLKLSFLFVALGIVPTVWFLLYNKVLESWVGDYRIRARCRNSPIQVEGFETSTLLVGVDSPVPEITTLYKYVILEDSSQHTTTDKKQLTKTKLIPKTIATTEELSKPHSLGFGVAAVDADPEGLLELGDIIVAINCQELEAVAGEKSQALLDRLLSRGSRNFFRLRFPIVLTVLRPKKGADICPPFSFGPVGPRPTDPPPEPECCLIADERCEDESFRIPSTTKARFIESIQSKVLTDLWKEQYNNNDETDVKQQQKSILAALFKGPNNNNDDDNDSNNNNNQDKITHPITGHQFKIKASGPYSSKTLVTLKLVAISVTCLLMTLGVAYVPLTAPNNSNLKTVMLSVLAFLGCATIIVWGVTLFGNFKSKKSVHDSLRQTDMIWCVLFLWVTIMTIPGALFVTFRMWDSNSDQRREVSIRVTCGFLGVIFSGVFVVHALLEVAKERFHLPVPSILSAHLSDLVLGLAAFITTAVDFVSLSRSLYGNGGVCNLANLNSELVKIQRGGESVSWACEANNDLSLDHDVAAGTTCNVMCSHRLVKPVTCYDYGLVGGEWTILRGLVSDPTTTDKFCCHPFVCDKNTQRYNHNNCNATHDGCEPK